MPVSAAETPLKKGDVVERPRNIVTNPSKRGTYGMIKLNIGQAAKGSVGEYTYSSDPYDLQRKKDIRERAESHKLRVTEKPFRPANPTRKGGPGVPGTTLGGAQGVIKEYEYIPPDYAKPPPVEKGLTPFVPTNPSKQGYNAPINKVSAFVVALCAAWARATLLPRLATACSSTHGGSRTDAPRARTHARLLSSSLRPRLRLIRTGRRSAPSTRRRSSTRSLSGRPRHSSQPR